MQKIDFQFEGKPTNPALVKILTAILTRKLDEADHSDPGFVLNAYAQKKAPSGYSVFSADVISKTDKGFMIKATAEKSTSIGNN